MFNKIKRYVLKNVANYHHVMGNYCYRKVDEYGPEQNDYWMKRVADHTVKELNIYAKLSNADV